jgi:hypothetical protein
MVYHHNRSQAASSNASHSLQGELEIWSSATWTDAEGVLQGFQDSGGVADVAGRALASANDVLPTRFQMELGVEGHHPEDLADRNVKVFANILKNGLRQIPISVLSGL